MAILKRVWGFLTAGTSTGVASTFLVMVATGLVGAAVFVYLDVGTQVWNGLSFLPSLATSVIGFLVGVPVAYYVIAEVVSRRDERKELHEVERLTVRGWDDFRDAIDSALTPQAREGILQASSILDGLSQVIAEYNIMRSVTVNGITRTEYELDRVSEGRRVAGLGHNGFIQSIHLMQFTEAWNVVRSRWHFIENQIKSTRLAHGLSWSNYETEKVLVNSIDLKPNPVEELYEVLQRRQESSPLVPIGNMRDAISSIDDFLGSQDEDLVKQRGGYQNVGLMVHDLSRALIAVKLLLDHVDEIVEKSAGDVFSEN